MICLRGDLYVAELWFGSSWTVYCVTWLWLDFLLSDLILPELSFRCFDFSWTVYWVNCFWVNYLMGDLTLAELWLDFSSWTVYWVTWLYLNCLLIDLTLAELSTGWLDFYWAEIWVCLLSDLTVLEPSTRWFDSGTLAELCFYFSWAVWVTWLWLNCLLVDMNYLLSDLTLAEPLTEWPDSSWPIYWLTWLWPNCLLGDLAIVELLYLVTRVFHRMIW